MPHYVPLALLALAALCFAFATADVVPGRLTPAGLTALALATLVLNA